METRKAFSERIANLRSEKGLKQAELAEKLAISRQSITMYEAGTRIPDIEILSRFANYFEVTADYLIGLSDNRTNETAAIGDVLGLTDGAIEKLTAIVEIQSDFDVILGDLGGEVEQNSVNEIVESGVLGDSFEAVYNNLWHIQSAVDLVCCDPELAISISRYVYNDNLLAEEKSDPELTEALHMYRLQKKLMALREFYADCAKDCIESKLSKKEDPAYAEEN